MFCYSIRLYYGQGESVLLRPLSGDHEEMAEIVTRLTAVSRGSEVRHVTSHFFVVVEKVSCISC